MNNGPRIAGVTVSLLAILGCGGESSFLGDGGYELVNGDAEVSAANAAFEGYTLFGQFGTTSTYLIDMDGLPAHTWDTAADGGFSVYLLENGNILRTARADDVAILGGGGTGILQEIDPHGNIVWNFEYNSATFLSHHDVEPMPNGNVLLIAWEVKSAAEAVEAGRRISREIWPEHIIEVDKGTSQIVWEWHAWDHLIQDCDSGKDNYGVVADHPELFDINSGNVTKDWMHLNGIGYHPDLDQIVISSLAMSEIYVIDHSTVDYDNPAAGIEAAAGHIGGNSGKGGDILYRWGNPQNYDASGIQYFDMVHCSYWIPAGYPGGGNILAFNNGNTQAYSEIIEITPPVDAFGHYAYTPGQPYEPSAPAWLYSEGPDFYSTNMGGNQRLPNGNTLINTNQGYLFEVTAADEKVWEYNHGSRIAKALRYAPSHPGIGNLLSVAVDLDKRPDP